MTVSMKALARRSAPMAIALTLCAIGATAQVGQLQTDRADEWYFDLTPYAWLAGMDGDITVRTIDTEVDTGLFDFFDQLDFAAMGKFEAGKGPWAIMADLTYLELSDDGDTPGPLVSDIDVEMDALILEIGGAYRVYHSDSGLLKRPVALRVLGGVRYTDVDLDLDITTTLPITDQSQSKDWIDPFIGAQTYIQWTPRFASSFRFDIGGFGVGSDLVYQLQSLYSIAVSERFDVVFGYRTLTYDYEDGSGTNKFEFDTTIAGPILGMNIAF